MQKQEQPPLYEKPVVGIERRNAPVGMHKNVLRIPDAKAETFATEHARLEMHHRIATLAVGLEHVAAHPDALAAFVAELAYEPIPEAARMRLRYVAEQYCEEIQHAIKAAELLELDNDHLTAGKKLFYAVTGFFPKGRVTAERREGYFILTCSDQQDFGLATTAGMRTASSTQESAGGVYHRALTVLTHELTIPLIVCTPSEKKDDVVTHERQHWINDKLFSHFAVTERGVSEATPTSKKTEYLEQLYAVDREPVGRDIKDEVLAYLREGRGGVAIAETLTTSALYTHLFTNEPERWKNLVARIGVAFDMHLSPYFSSKERRAVLVAQLASIPLERMPSAMKKLGDYYRQRNEALSAAWNEDLVEAAGRINTIVHPDIAPSVHELNDRLAYHAALRKTVASAVVGSNGVFVSDAELAAHALQVREAADHALHTFAKIRSLEANRGARFPSLWHIESTNADTAHDSTWEQRAQRIGETIVTALEKIPLVDIDGAYEEAARHRVDHKTERLALRIANDLHAATGHTFTVDMGEPLHDPKQFSPRITQAATDTLPAITYHANMYCNETPAN